VTFSVAGGTTQEPGTPRIGPGPAKRAPGRGGPLRVRLRRLAGSTVGWAFETFGGPPPGLVPGGGTANDDRPVVVVLLFGATEDAVAATARDLAASLAAGGPRPVLVLDGPHFAAARRAGVVVDHLLSREDWAARGYAEWDTFLAGELDRLRRDLRTRHVVTLTPAGTAGMGAAELRDLLTPPGRRPGPLRRLWWRAVVRVERRVDRTSGAKPEGRQ
jgi:hypothetical protein